MTTAILERPFTPAERPRAEAHATARAWLWLAMGLAVVPLTQLRWNVALLGWVAPVPFLVYLRHARGWRDRALLLGALLVAFNLQWMKAITFPTPALIAPLYAVPIALVWWTIYLVWDAVRRKAGERWALYAFPALVALAEVASYRLTVFGIWGTPVRTVYAQFGDLPALGYVMILFLALLASRRGRAA